MDKPMTREQDITFAAKEWLIRHSWKVITYNPPGAQGTFTIPNPEKKEGYRGQSGSKAPDIVATKDASLLLVESKPYYQESDVQKLIDLVENKERKDILFEIVNKVADAQGIEFNQESEVVLAKSHSGKPHPHDKVKTIHVNIDSSWDPGLINARQDFFNYFSVNLYSDKGLV